MFVIWIWTNTHTHPWPSLGLSDSGWRVLLISDAGADLAACTEKNGCLFLHGKT